MKRKIVSFNVKREGQFYKVIARTRDGKIIKFRRKTYDGVIYKLDIVPSQFRSVYRKASVNEGLYYVIRPLGIPGGGKPSPIKSKLHIVRKAKHDKSR